jgi:hypothetical protein
MDKVCGTRGEIDGKVGRRGKGKEAGSTADDARRKRRAVAKRPDPLGDETIGGSDDAVRPSSSPRAPGDLSPFLRERERERERTNLMMITVYSPKTKNT